MAQSAFRLIARYPYVVEERPETEDDDDDDAKLLKIWDDRHSMGMLAALEKMNAVLGQDVEERGLRKLMDAPDLFRNVGNRCDKDRFDRFMEDAGLRHDERSAVINRLAQDDGIHEKTFRSAIARLRPANAFLDDPLWSPRGSGDEESRN